MGGACASADIGCLPAIRYCRQQSCHRLLPSAVMNGETGMLERDVSGSIIAKAGREVKQAQARMAAARPVPFILLRTKSQRPRLMEWFDACLNRNNGPDTPGWNRKLVEVSVLLARLGCGQVLPVHHESRTSLGAQRSVPALSHPLLLWYNRKHEKGDHGRAWRTSYDSKSKVPRAVSTSWEHKMLVDFRFGLGKRGNHG